MRDRIPLIIFCFKREFRAPRKSIWFGLAWVIVACWLLQPSIERSINSLSLIRHGQTTSGFIANAWVHFDEDDEERGAEYTFRLPDGREFTGKGDISDEMLGDIDDLDSLSENPYPAEIEYVPDEPTANRLKGTGEATISEWLGRSSLGLLFLCFAFAPGLAAVWHGIHDINKQWKAERKLLAQ